MSVVPSTHVPTIEDARALDLPPGEKSEIINGRILVSPMKELRNVFIAARLHDALQDALPRTKYWVLQGINLGDRFEYFIPDLVVADAAAFEAGARSGDLLLDPAAAVLVVEVVSPGARSHERDYVDKALAYMRRGVPRYWILDPVTRAVTEVTAQGRTSTIEGRIVEDYRIGIDVEALVQFDDRG